MDQKPKGPYKHVERPTESRVNTHDDNMGSSRWGAIIIILIVIIIALIPIVHKFASERQKSTTQPAKTTMVAHSSSKKTNAFKPKIKVKKSNKSQNATSNSLKSSSMNSSSSQTMQSSSSSVETPKIYVVQEGDTLSSIAAKHGMSVSALAELNDLDSDSGVNAGQTLKLHDEQ